jgi:hypothetical protein
MVKLVSKTAPATIVEELKLANLGQKVAQSRQACGAAASNGGRSESRYDSRKA